MDKLEVYDALAIVIRAMANGRRLELVEVLAQGEHSVDALSGMTGIGVTTVSAGLQTMKQAGLVKTRRAGTTIYYRLAGPEIVQLYVAAKRVGLLRSPELRVRLAEYMGEIAGEQSVSLIDPAAITSDMTVVDVRPALEFEAGHFPGALSIPLDELPERFREIPADAEIVLYCRGEFCRMAREAAVWLRGRGIEAKAMDEGVIEWRASQEDGLDRSA